MSWMFFICSILAALVILLVITVISKGIKEKDVIAKKCGHRTKKKGTITAFRDKRRIQIPENEDGSVDYCLGCLQRMTTKCYWCGEPIFIGDPVAIDTPGEEHTPPSSYSVYKKDPLKVIVCLGYGCGDGAIDRSGFWQPPGEVYLVLSPAEQCKQNTVPVTDLSKPDEAIPIPELQN